MAITDDLLQLTDQQPPPQNSWIKDLIDKRYQPKTERLKRTPVGFDFKRDPFDPSSYYKQLGTFKDISRLATNVTETEAANRAEAEQQRAYEESQRAMQNALKGINPNFTYGNVTTGSTTSKKYHLKGLSPITSKAADYWGSKYGIGTVYGKGPGSVPGSDHPKGRALDFMVYNNKAKGTALANDLIKNASNWNIKYLIWYHYIWYPGSGWHKYSGPSPHTDHVHVSFNK